MNRPLLKLKPPAPVAPEPPSLPSLPPRPPKGESAEKQLLSFIIVDRKPHHHASYATATEEREYLQAEAATKKWFGKWRPKYRIMKVLNLPGEQLQDKIVLHADTVDEIALEAALVTFAEHWSTDITDSERIYMRKVLQSYLDALRPAQP